MQQEQKNAQRIIILGAPQKTSRNLDMIDRRIYKNDPYMLVEWHYYQTTTLALLGPTNSF